MNTTKTCATCKFYSSPKNDTDLTCVVNPGGQASDCASYTMIVGENALETALIVRKKADYEAFRQEALTIYGVEMPDVHFTSQWLIPQIVITRIKEFLPQVLGHEKAEAYTEEQIILALVEWAEGKISYYLDECDLERALSNGVWEILEHHKTESNQ